MYGDTGFVACWTRRKKRKRVLTVLAKTTRVATKKRKGLSLLLRGKGKTKECEERHVNFLAVAQRTRRAKEKIQTEGYFCPNKRCEYYRITESENHALVDYESHGAQEMIRDLKCQACGKKFIARRNTILYRLKSHSELIVRILWLLALGVDVSALEEVFGVREIAIRTWLCQGGMQEKNLHECFLIELQLVHVQLDELWAKVKDKGQDMWLWIASDAKTKIIPVFQVGARNQDMAYAVVLS